MLIIYANPNYAVKNTYKGIIRKGTLPKSYKGRY